MDVNVGDFFKMKIVSSPRGGDHAFREGIVKILGMSPHADQTSDYIIDVEFIYDPLGLYKKGDLKYAFKQRLIEKINKESFLSNEEASHLLKNGPLK